MRPAPFCPAATRSPARRPLTARLMAATMALALAIGALVAAPAARAQSPFAAAVYVNDDAITNYDVTQKSRFLEFIGVSSPDMRRLAIDRLIEDRLQIQEGRRLGGRMTPDALTSGMAEFAARAQLTTDEMITRLAAAGIDRETFVSFITAGVIWGELVQARFGAQVTITEAMIDQALSVEGVQPSTEVLISEIFLPAEAQFAETVQRIIPQIQRIRSETEFSNAARQVSAAPSGPSGGRVDRWINVSAMPEAVGSQMANAPVGTVIGPLEMPGAYAFFQLRARRDSRSVPPTAIEISYRRVGLPGGRSETNLAHVARIRDGVDSCVDFDGVVLREVPGLPDGAVTAITRRQSEMTAAERTELERLNPGQISANMVDGDALVLLMLCARSVAADAAPPRPQVRAALMNRALEGQAAIYLQRLRTEADIRYP